MIAGGIVKFFVKDSYIFDIKNNTIKAANDLPIEGFFDSPSATVIDNNLYVVGCVVGWHRTVLKFSMKDEKWE